MAGTQWPLVSLLLRPEKVSSLPDVVAAAVRHGAPVYVAGSPVFDRIAGFPVHRGVLALARRRPEPGGAELLQRIGDPPVILAVEGVNDHENLGALFRNAAALGAGAVLLDPTCCDPLYRRAIRVSVGHVLRVPFGRITPWPAGLHSLRARGFALLALTPAAPLALDEVTPSLPPRVALLVGAEGPGLSAPALESATHRARIPMAGGVDSLNVATAAAIALHRLGSRPGV